MKLTIFGVTMNTASKETICAMVQRILEKQEKGKVIVTPNPEFLLEARKNPNFQYQLNQADIALPDGHGLVLASWFLGKNGLRVIHGSDFMLDILQIALKMKKRVLFLCSRGGLSSADEISRAFSKKFPFLICKAVAVVSGHPMINRNTTLHDESVSQKAFLSEILSFQPDIVLVGLGQRFQEDWIFQNKPKLPCVNIFMGVGGSFDFYTGKRKRAPKIFRSLGLEWLWRLILQPRKRFVRIWNATILFPFKVLFSRTS